MPETVDRLMSLRVANVMAKEVLSVGKNQTMTEAAAILAKNHVSAAPVVDELGHCVGIITASDFVTRENEIAQANHGGSSELELTPPNSETSYRCVPVGEDYVSYHMSQAVQSIDSGASLLAAARIMCAEHIHRLLVIDTQNHPIGVISTMDIMAAMVNVVDAMKRDLGRSEG